MKVIFIKDLKKEGKKGDIKTVADGYATNFLIAKGYAVKYTKTSNNILEKEIKTASEKEREEIKRANEIKEKLSKEKLIFTLSSKNGKTSGIISGKMVEEVLKTKGYDIDKKKINITIPLNTIGFHHIIIELHKKVLCNLLIEIKQK